MIKRLFVGLMMTGFILVSGFAANAAIYVDEQELVGASSVMVAGRTMVPMRVIFEKMGVTVSWNGEAKSITAVKGDTTIVLVVGSNAASINGASSAIDAAPSIIDGKVYVPLRFSASAFGGDVKYDSITKKVEIFLIKDDLIDDSENNLEDNDSVQITMIEKGELNINGDKYSGELINGKPNGQGTMEYASGGKYTGEFKNGIPDGKGTLLISGGDKYIGDFKNGRIDGQGTYLFVSGEKYAGEFKDDLMSGKGTLEFPRGDKYVGEFMDDEYNGFGIFTFANGKIQQGIWKNSKFIKRQAEPTVESNEMKITYGTLRFSGGIYTGEIKNGKANGQGTMTYADGTVKKGIWKDDEFVKSQSNPTISSNSVQTIFRTIIFTNGDKYDGEMRDGKYNGQGTYIFANGVKYVGEFKDGSFNGQGTKTYIDGTYAKGIWKDNKLVQPQVVTAQKRIEDNYSKVSISDIGVIRDANVTFSGTINSKSVTEQAGKIPFTTLYFLNGNWVVKATYVGKTSKKAGDYVTLYGITSWYPRGRPSVASFFCDSITGGDRNFQTMRNGFPSISY